MLKLTAAEFKKTTVLIKRKSGELHSFADNRYVTSKMEQFSDKMFYYCCKLNTS